MNNIKIKLNKTNIKAILQSEMMMDATKDTAVKEGQIDTSFVGFDRVQVIVKKEK